MGAWYPWIVLLHLACAIVFVGAVTFEVLVGIVFLAKTMFYL